MVATVVTAATRATATEDTEDMEVDSEVDSEVAASAAASNRSIRSYVSSSLDPEPVCYLRMLKSAHQRSLCLKSGILNRN